MRSSWHHARPTCTSRAITRPTAGVCVSLRTRSADPQLIALPTRNLLALCGSVYEEDDPFAALYDPELDTWTARPAPRRRITSPAVVLADGRVLVVDVSAGAFFDSVSGTWDDAAIPDVRAVPGQYNPDALTVLEDGRVLFSMGLSTFVFTP